MNKEGKKNNEKRDKVKHSIKMKYKQKGLSCLEIRLRRKARYIYVKAAARKEKYRGKKRLE